ncbi:MAG: hypothetical protein AABY75_06180 [Bacteroidota bacterium]
MTRADQQRLFEDLVGQLHRMTSADREVFLALQRRNKDDEDLDAPSASRLERLHATYKPPKSKKDLENIWKKIISGPIKS